MSSFKVTNKINLKEIPTLVSDKKATKKLKKNRKALSKLQEKMYAEGKYSVLICLQGMDTSGKDSLIKEVFKEHAPNLNISSTKSMTGHLLGAAGAIEAIACVKAVQEDIVPPTINFEHEDENIDYSLNYTLNKAQKREVRAALSNTFGFGGHNTSVVVKKYNA